MLRRSRNFGEMRSFTKWTVIPRNKGFDLQKAMNCQLNSQNSRSDRLGQFSLLPHFLLDWSTFFHNRKDVSRVALLLISPDAKHFRPKDFEIFKQTEGYIIRILLRQQKSVKKTLGVKTQIITMINYRCASSNTINENRHNMNNNILSGWSFRENIVLFVVRRFTPMSTGR